MSDTNTDHAADQAAAEADQSDCADWGANAAPYAGGVAAWGLSAAHVPQPGPTVGGIYVAHHSADALNDLCQWGQQYFDQSLHQDMQGAYVLDKVGDPYADNHHDDYGQHDDYGGSGTGDHGGFAQDGPNFDGHAGGASAAEGDYGGGAGFDSGFDGGSSGGSDYGGGDSGHDDGAGF